MKTASALVLGLAVLAACAEAGGEATGGGLTTAGERAATAPPFTPPTVDAGTSCGTGTKWSELYRDIFGNKGSPGSCSFAANCHGSPEGEGTRSSAGIACFDEAGCRQSMLDQQLVKVTNAPAPEGATLFNILRIREASGAVGGIMPKEPASFVYPPACIERMKGWIANGSPAD